MSKSLKICSKIQRARTNNKPFVELERMARESIEKGELRDYPVEYLAALMDNQAAMTIQFITRSEGKQVDYQKIGFGTH